MKTPTYSKFIRIAALASAFALTTYHSLAGLVGNGFDGRLYTIDINSGATSLIGNTGTSSLMGISVSPTTGELYGLTNFVGMPPSSLVKIDPMSAATMTIGATGIPVIEGDLAFNPLTGQLFGTQTQNTPNSNLLRINPLTGAATIVGSMGSSSLTDFSAIAFNLAGTLFAIDTGKGLRETVFYLQ